MPPARPRPHAATGPSIAVSRRQLIAGAAGIAGIALASSGIAHLTSQKEEAAEDSSALSVAPDVARRKHDSFRGVVPAVQLIKDESGKVAGCICLAQVGQEQK